jgi:hypothetical protein
MKQYRIYRVKTIESQSDGQLSFCNTYLEYFSDKKEAIEIFNKKLRDKWGCIPKLLQESVGDGWVNISRRQK